MNSRQIIAVAAVSTALVIVLNKVGFVDVIYRMIGGE